MLNPILKKEIRLLKGSILAGTGLIALLWIYHIWVNNTQASFSNFWTVGLFALLLSHITTTAFGFEISERFFANWLTQPQTRRQLWYYKLFPMLTTYLIFGCLLSILLLVAEGTLENLANGDQLYTALPCILIGCFGPGIYYNLKLKNPTAALWLTVVCLPFLWVLALWCASLVLPANMQSTEAVFTGLRWWVWCVFLAYGAWGLIAAQRLFLQWEDIGTEGKALELRFRKSKTEQPTRKISSRKGPSPFRKYLLNEIHIQQLNIVIGLVMVAAIWVTHYWAVNRSASVHTNDETQKLIAMLPSMFRYMIFLLPCSIAALAIADNRRQDVITWELMLPLSKRVKWMIKLSLCLFLSWLFTIGLPWSYDNRILFESFKPETKYTAFIILNIAAVVIANLSLYLSSLSASYLRSFSFSLGLLPLMAFFLGFINVLNMEDMSTHFPIGYFAVPTGVLLLVSFMAVYWSRKNFEAPHILRQHKLQNLKHWGWSFFIIALWSGIMVDRSWERLTLREPTLKPIEILSANHIRTDAWSQENLFSHEPKPGTRNSIRKVHPRLGDNMHSLSSIALKPDGRLSLVDSKELLRLGSLYNIPTPFTPAVKPILLNRSVPQGRDLVSEALVTATDATFYHRFVLDTSGKLFNWSQESEIQAARSDTIATYAIQPEPMAPDFRFKYLCAMPTAIYALDEHQVLWGAHYEKEGNTYTKTLAPFKPMFPQYTWKEIARTPIGIIALKENGTLWTWGIGRVYTGLPQGERPDPNELVQVFDFKKWKSIHPHTDQFLAEAEDGSFWIITPSFNFLSAEQKKIIKSRRYRFLCRVDIPDLAQYSPSDDDESPTQFRWINQRGELYAADLLAENWDTNLDQEMIIKPIDIRRIGHRSDWVYLTNGAGMTSDGKIWNWDRLQSNRWNPFPARWRHQVVAEEPR